MSEEPDPVEEARAYYSAALAQQAETNRLLREIADGGAAIVQSQGAGPFGPLELPRPVPPAIAALFAGPRG